jgi:amidase
VPVEPEVVAAIEGATRHFVALGAAVTAASPDFAGLKEAVLATRGLSMVANHADRLRDWREQMQDGLVWNIDHGLKLSARQIARGEVLRAELFHRARAFFDSFDVLLTPTVPILPFPVDRPYPTAIAGRPVEDPIDWFLLTYAFSLIGAPAMSVPCGFSADGLPIGLQIVGPWRGEETVIAAAAAFERAAPWHDRYPPIVPGASNG